MSVNPNSLFKMIRVSSQNRVNGTSGKFTVDFSSDPTVHEVIECHVVSCSFLHNFYNVVDRFNRLLVLSGGILYPINIPEGFYNITQLLAEIKTQFDALVGFPITFTQDSLTQKISWSIAGTTASFNTILDNPDSYVSVLLGNSTTEVEAASGTFSDTPNLQGVQHVFVNSSTINPGGNLLSKTGFYDDTFLSVPIDVPFSAIVTYKSPSTAFVDRIVYNSARDFSTIDIRLTDDRGVQLDLGENHEFVLVLKIYYTT